MDMCVLTTFIKSASRNHLIFTDGCVDGYTYVDVGLQVSEYIEYRLSDRRLSMRTQDFVNTLLRDNVQQSQVIGSYLALSNLGILFEPLLKMDIEALFNRWSQNNTLIINMDIGSVENNRFSLVKNAPEQYSVSLHAINHIVLP